MVGLKRPLGEISVKRSDDLRAFADGSGDALDGTGAHVADGEDSSAAGFQELACGIADSDAGEHEAFTIERNAGVVQPVPVRIGADERMSMRPGAWSPTRAR
jgi:hypothetical protein